MTRLKSQKFGQEKKNCCYRLCENLFKQRVVYLLYQNPLWQILSDTRELQKEINSLTGKLDRTFAVTDELVFKVVYLFIQIVCLPEILTLKI